MKQENLRDRRVFVNGGGATFPYPIYAKWFHEYRRYNPDAWINYQSIGSGAGIRQLLAGTLDFGATDIPMTELQVRRFQMPVLHLPTVIGAIVPSYNLPGVNGDLRLTPQLLADIYMGRIDTWRDPALLAVNSHLHLPDQRIIVVHRSDGSGTTYVWTDYLAKVSPEWRTRIGTGAAVHWPAGLGAKGNEGVAGLIKQTPHSIGYLELVFANHSGLPHCAVRNTRGVFVRADSRTIAAAARISVPAMPEDFRVSITDASGEDAYPIASFTWLLVPARIENAAKRNVLKHFLRWMLRDGKPAAELLGYVALPPQVVDKELLAIERIQ